MAADGGDFSAFEPRQLLFQELERRLDPAEVDEVRQVIGSELVEGNADLATEVNQLHDVLLAARDGNQEARETLSRLQAAGGALAAPAAPAAPKRQAVQVLQQQILYFVDRIRAATGPNKRRADVPALALPAAEGTAIPPVLATTPREGAVYAYVASARPASSPAPGDAARGSGHDNSRFLSPSRRRARLASAAGSATDAFALPARPPTAGARLRDALAGPGGAAAGGVSRPSTASTAGWSLSSAPEVLDSMAEHMSVFALHRIVAQLREALAEEAEGLAADREYLEVCLREERQVGMALAAQVAARRRAHAPVQPSAGAGADAPSVEELKAYKARLQSTWLDMEGAGGGEEESGAEAEAAPVPTPRGRGLAGRLRGAVQAAAPAAPSPPSKAGTAAGIMDDLEELFG